MVAGLGRRRGVAEIRGVRIMGWPAYALHRAYHLWAMPTAERKARILLDWVAAALLGRDPVAAAPWCRPRAGVTRTSPSSAAATPQTSGVRDSAPARSAPASGLSRWTSPAIDGPTLREPHPSFPTAARAAPVGRDAGRRPRARGATDGPMTGDQPALSWIARGRHDLPVIAGRCMEFRDHA